jgi:hypothetical protein
MNSRVLRSIILCTKVWLVCVAAATAPAVAQPPARQTRARNQEPRSDVNFIRVYAVEDLLYQPSDYPYRSGMPTVAPFESTRGLGLGRSGGMGGGAGGMGGGMGGGGMGGGGGMFSVPAENAPPEILRQFGGGGGGQGAGPAQPAGGGSGMGGITPGGRVPRAAQLINLIKSLIKVEWEDEQGANDTSSQCLLFGTNLVVRTNAHSHEQIAELLKALQATNGARSVTVEATWILLDAQKLESLRAAQGSGPVASLKLDRKWLTEVARDTASFRGQLTCLNGQTVHFATGQRRVIPSGATPTVGVGAAGYSTSTEVLNIGAVLQVTPILMTASDRRWATLDLHSVVTQWGKQGEPIHVTSQTATGSSEKTLAGPLVNNVATIDRANVGTLEWSTTVEVPLGEPVLVGAATLTDASDQTVNTDEVKRPQLGLVVEVRRTSEN